MSITTKRKSEENSQSHLISYRSSRFHENLNTASQLTPTLVKAHTYYTNLAKLVRRQQVTKLKERKKMLRAKISYHWSLLSNLPFSPLPSYKTWAALGSLSHPDPGLHYDPAVLFLRLWKQAGFSICSQFQEQLPQADAYLAEHYMR